MNYRYRPKKNRPYFRKRRLKKGTSVLRRAPFVNEMRTGKARHKSAKWRKGDIVRWIFIGGIIAGFAAILGVGIVFVWVSRDLPDPNRLLTREVEKSTKIWDRSGEHLLYEIHGDQKRTIVETNDIAPVAIQATLASEDRRFYEHRGVQLKSLVRALWVAVTKTGRVQGTSTITQQLVKNAILSNERTITRKAKELILSYQIERKFTKDEILKLYFNEIPYGSVNYGIEAASQSFFGKSAKDLDAAEAALLSVLPKAATRYSPYGSHTDELLWWKDFVLDTMVEEGYLTREEADEAKEVDILARIRPRTEGIKAPHFSLYVKELLADEYGEREVETGGLNIITSLDWDKQLAAEEAIADGIENIRERGGTNAALISLDPKNGHVLAMVGSADYFNDEIGGQVNVTLRPRQPGSSFKPIAYASAFRKGFTPDTIIFDVETTFSEGPDAYEPKNYDLDERGPVTMRTALQGSLNIPAVKTLYLAGLGDTVEFAKSLGYTTLDDKNRFGLSLVLGGGEVKPIEHASALGTFANDGIRHEPVIILKVEDADGNILQEWKEKEGTKVMDAEVARTLNDVLSDNEARSYMFGENSYLQLGERPVAAKTGTTNDFRDAWTVGYTPSLVTAVWSGNNNNSKMKSRASGSTLAAPIWNAYMRKALDNTPIETFPKPELQKTGKPVLDGQAGETVFLIDKFSGKLASENTPSSAIEEKVYRQAHSILYYVDPKDPRGAQPSDPASDPQFEKWEEAVITWAEENNWTTDEEPPMEIDDLHDPAFAPMVRITRPVDGASLPVRNFIAQAEASAPRNINRVEYYLEGVYLGESNRYPWDAVLNIPSIFDKGFYTLSAIAYDEVDQNSMQEITVNVQSEGTDLTVDWRRPTANIGYRRSAFPIFIDARLSENRGIENVEIYAVPKEGESIKIGSLKNPHTKGVSVTWTKPPETGEYILRAVVRLSFGKDRVFEGPTITVK